MILITFTKTVNFNVIIALDKENITSGSRVGLDYFTDNGKRPGRLGIAQDNFGKFKRRWQLKMLLN